MKKLWPVFVVFLLLAVLTACAPVTPPAESTAPPETNASDEVLTGWQTIDGNRYCFSPEGKPLTGWLTEGKNRYYLDEAGMVLTGWQDISGKRFYFGTDGAMNVGWVQLDGSTYYFGMDGSLFTGLLNIGGKGYFFDESGRMSSGWQEVKGQTYYFDAEGIMAVGQVEIDGQVHHFSPHGVKILLVNPWNTLPADYEVTLVNLTEQDRLETECAEALTRMLDACEAAGYKTMIVSAYRTREEQEYLYYRKVRSYVDMDWTWDNARKEAAKSVAPPDTSEHQLGLAVDLIDVNYGFLDEYQAQMPAQKWLMEHCHEYGFILRYPVGSTEITGIIYEPWHYRYVGVEIAQEIMNLGITLEEYLGAA